MNNKIVLELIFESIDEINELKATNPKLQKEIDSILVGKSSVLDSLDLVNLLVSIEESIEDKFDIPITIANEKAMSMKSSPFRTIGTLCDYIVELIGT